MALQGSYPGVEIDPAGAGDHLNMIDTKIRRVKEIMRSVIAGLPYKLAKERIKDLTTYAVNRTNLKSSQGLISNESPCVRFTGIKPDFKAEFGLSFGDYVEAYNPRAQGKSNDITEPRTEPCIALYPSANKNGSWILYNLNTKAYVRRTQWKRLPTSQLVIKVMNELAGDKCITLGDLDTGDAGVQKADQIADENITDATHIPVMDPLGVPTAEEDAICDDVLNELPELEAQGVDEESVSEEEDDESVVCDDDEGPDDIAAILESVDSDTSSMIREQPTVATRRTTRQNAGVKRLDESYHWNLMNMSLGAAIRNFGDAARDACKAEL